ncbi:MAG: ComF family protein [Alphaproteobacteria bacterium]|nr:ComF family protein [Alphaproteobacteria bacterium]
MLAGLRRVGGLALDLVLPARCLACGGEVDRQGQLCAPCWRAIRFLAPPCCACCGFPFAYDEGGGARCAACLARPPSFARARAAFVYDDASRGLVLAFKHADRTHAAPAFAPWLARAGADLLAEAELLAPVPLHRWRLLARRYNQAALLSAALARLGGLPHRADLLQRRRWTPSQGRMSRTERRRNVAGAFRVRPRHCDMVAGRRVLLVDDVLTTGATVEACARALLRSGARAVDVLTLARVVRPMAGH